MGHGPEQAVPGGRVLPVGQGAKLGEQVEDARRHRPAERQEAADLRARRSRRRRASSGPVSKGQIFSSCPQSRSRRPERRSTAHMQTGSGHPPSVARNSKSIAQMWAKAMIRSALQELHDQVVEAVDALCSEGEAQRSRSDLSGQPGPGSRPAAGSPRSRQRPCRRPSGPTCRAVRAIGARRQPPSVVPTVVAREPHRPQEHGPGAGRQM